MNDISGAVLLLTAIIATVTGPWPLGENEAYNPVLFSFACTIGGMTCAGVLLT